MKDMSDYYNIIDTAAEEAEKRGMEKGLELGREEGREEGRKEGVRAVAKEMKTLGIPFETIVKATGLAEEVIAEL